MHHNCTKFSASSLDSPKTVPVYSPSLQVKYFAYSDCTVYSPKCLCHVHLLRLYFVLGIPFSDLGVQAWGLTQMSWCPAPIVPAHHCPYLSLPVLALVLSLPILALVPSLPVLALNPSLPILALIVLFVLCL